MKNKLHIKVLLPILLLVLVILLPISYARYTSNYQGPFNIGIAKWDIIINDNSHTDEHTFDLFETINNDDVNKNIKVLAPGSKGSITFNITNNSDVVSECTIEVLETNNIYDIPILYSLSEDSEYKELEEIEIAKNLEIGLGLKKTITLYWEWPFFKDELQNQKDNELANNQDAKILITTNVKVNQKIN